MKKGIYPAINKANGKVEMFDAYESIPSTGYMKQASIKINLKNTETDKGGENTIVMCKCTLDDLKNITYTKEYCLHRSAEPKGGKTGSIKYLVWIDGNNEKHNRILFGEAEWYRKYKPNSVDTDIWDSSKSYKDGEEWSWVIRAKEGTIKEYLPNEFESTFGVPYKKLPRVTGGIGYINLKNK